MSQLPEKFVERFKQIVPCGVSIEDLFKEKPFKSFRINTLKTSHAQIWVYLQDLKIAYQTVAWFPDAFVVNQVDGAKLLASSLCLQGNIYAQGLESMLAPLVLDPKSGWHVLDLCAAPGSKTTQIAALMGNQGQIFANEPVRNRFFRLKAVVDLLGVQATLTSKDGRFFRGDKMFDGILVDAPCSSEGRFSIGRPKSHAFWSVRKIHEMAHKQKGLLLNASRLLKKGGTLVYATCTFGPEENEDVVTWFLKQTKGQFSLQTIQMDNIKTYPSSLPACLRVMPTDTMEGFFLAKFKA